MPRRRRYIRSVFTSRYDLELLVAIDRHNSKRRAAKECETSESYVSQRIKTLTVAAGGPLFVRGRRGSVTTTLGEKAVAEARRLIRHMEKSDRALK